MRIKVTKSMRIDIHGGVQELEPLNGTDFTIEELKSFIYTDLNKKRTPEHAYSFDEGGDEEPIEEGDTKEFRTAPKDVVVEFVSIPPQFSEDLSRFYIVCDEEGKIKGLDKNISATELCMPIIKDPVSGKKVYSDTLVGNVALIDKRLVR